MLCQGRTLHNLIPTVLQTFSKPVVMQHAELLIFIFAGTFGPWIMKKGYDCSHE